MKIEIEHFGDRLGQRIESKDKERINNRYPHQSLSSKEMDYHWQSNDNDIPA